MKKIIFVLVLFALVSFLVVAVFGVYKFNSLSGRLGYDVDGNECQQCDPARGCGDISTCPG